MKPMEIRDDMVKKTELAVAIAQSDVRNIFSLAIEKYYGEFTPIAYVRTRNLPNALKISAIRGTGNGHEADVFLNSAGMHYAKGLVPLQWKTSKGKQGWTGYGYATWSANKVLYHAANGSHGGYRGGTSIWYEPLGRTAAEHKAILKSACKKAGL